MILYIYTHTISILLYMSKLIRLYSLITCNLLYFAMMELKKYKWICGQFPHLLCIMNFKVSLFSSEESAGVKHFLGANIFTVNQ